MLYIQYKYDDVYIVYKLKIINNKLKLKIYNLKTISLTCDMVLRTLLYGACFYFFLFCLPLVPIFEIALAHKLVNGSPIANL